MSPEGSASPSSGTSRQQTGQVEAKTGSWADKGRPRDSGVKQGHVAGTPGRYNPSMRAIATVQKRGARDGLQTTEPVTFRSPALKILPSGATCTIILCCRLIRFVSSPHRLPCQRPRSPFPLQPARPVLLHFQQLAQPALSQHPRCCPCYRISFRRRAPVQRVRCYLHRAWYLNRCLRQRVLRARLFRRH